MTPSEQVSEIVREWGSDDPPMDAIIKGLEEMKEAITEALEKIDSFALECNELTEIEKEIDKKISLLRGDL